MKSPRNSTAKRRRTATGKNVLTPNATAEYLRPSTCPTCNSDIVYKHVKTYKTIIDLRFARHGVKRWITQHTGHRYQCSSCRSTFLPPGWCLQSNKYGPGLQDIQHNAVPSPARPCWSSSVLGQPLRSAHSRTHQGAADPYLKADVVAYSIYLNIELRLPQERISSNLSKLFGLPVTGRTMNRFKVQAAEAYRKLY